MWSKKQFEIKRYDPYTSSKCIATLGLLVSHWGSTNVGLLGAYHLKINFITCESLKLFKEGIVHLCGTPLIHLVKWVYPRLRIMIGQYWCSF